MLWDHVQASGSAPTRGEVVAAPGWGGAKQGVHMASLSSGFHGETSGLFEWTRELVPELQGQCRCFAVQKMGAEVVLEDCVLVKVRIQNAADFTMGNEGPTGIAEAAGFRLQKAAVRMTRSQWDMLGRHVQEFRLLQAMVTLDEQIFVLDVTTTPAFMAGYAPLLTGETLKVAELFSGGFLGWSRAGFALRDVGVPWHTSWFLDADCTFAEPPLRYLEPNVTVVSTAEQLSALPCDSTPVFLAADFRSSWWRNIAALRPAHMACVSPPCQPWSRAGRQSGLDTQDGRLLIQVPVFWVHRVLLLSLLKRLLA